MGATTPWQFFTSFTSPELARAVRDGRRAEFAGHGGHWDAGDVPDPQEVATRDRSVLDWSEPGRPDQARMLAWYRALIALRRSSPELLDDDLRQVRMDTGTTWVALHRGRFRVLVNIGPDPAALPCVPGSAARLTFGEVDEPVGDTVLVGPDSVAVMISA